MSAGRFSLPPGMILLTKDEKVDKTDVLQVADGQPDFLAFTVNGQHEVNLGEVASVRQVPKDMDHREDDALNANKISIVIDVPGYGVFKCHKYAHRTKSGEKRAITYGKLAQIIANVAWQFITHAKTQASNPHRFGEQLNLKDLYLVALCRRLRCTYVCVLGYYPSGYLAAALPGSLSPVALHDANSDLPSASHLTPSSSSGSMLSSSASSRSFGPLQTSASPLSIRSVGSHTLSAQPYLGIQANNQLESTRSRNNARYIPYKRATWHPFSSQAPYAGYNQFASTPAATTLAPSISCANPVPSLDDSRAAPWTGVRSFSLGSVCPQARYLEQQNIPYSAISSYPVPGDGVVDPKQVCTVDLDAASSTVDTLDASYNGAIWNTVEAQMSVIASPSDSYVDANGYFSSEFDQSMGSGFLPQDYSKAVSTICEEPSFFENLDGGFSLECQYPRSSYMDPLCEESGRWQGLPPD